MSAPSHLPIDLLPPEQRDQVKAWYYEALKRPEVKLSLEEAAWLYGYKYQSLRWAVMRRKLQVTRKRGKVLVTHVDMRNYIQAVPQRGRNRKGLKQRRVLLA